MISRVVCRKIFQSFSIDDGLYILFLAVLRRTRGDIPLDGASFDWNVLTIKCSCKLPLWCGEDESIGELKCENV